MIPPSPYRTIDTLKISRKYFGLLSHKQDDIGEFIGTGRKIKVDKQLWLDCIKGDKKALRLMAKYNAQDVILLERNYLRYRPWIANHPSLGIYIDGTACPKCGSKSLQRRGYIYKSTTKYRKIWCKNCNGWSRTTVNERGSKPLVSI